MRAEVQIALIAVGVILLGYASKVLEAGKGVQELLGGISSGVSSLLSPQIRPAFVPEIKIVPEIGIKITSDVCWPWWPLNTPCTVSSRGTGALPGGGSASAGFLPNYPYTDPSGKTWLSATSYLNI